LLAISLPCRFPAGRKDQRQREASAAMNSSPEDEEQDLDENQLVRER
jgi:hypothetical protein